MSDNRPMLSWAAQVIADNSGKWCGNTLRFATEAEALFYVRDLAIRWTLVRQTRAVRSPDPVTERWNADLNKAVPLEPNNHG